MPEPIEPIPYARIAKPRIMPLAREALPFVLAALLMNAIWWTFVKATIMSETAIKLNVQVTPKPALLALVYRIVSHGSAVIWGGTLAIWLACAGCYAIRRRGADVRASAVLAFGLAVLVLLMVFVALLLVLWLIPIDGGLQGR